MKEFKNIIVDECHGINSKGGMYQHFIHSIEGCKVLGLTATPYRLSSTLEGAMLKFLTRTNPRIFNKVLYYIQNSELFDNGYLAKLEYFSFNLIDRKMISTNSSGSDYSDKSMRAYFRSNNITGLTITYANRLLFKRKNLLIFCASIEDAFNISSKITGSSVLTSKTDPRQRENILIKFKAGLIKCLINVGILTTGFDYPELECVLIARPTMSLALYYQMIGRCMRPHPDKKSAWVVDIGGNINFFGKIETMKIHISQNGLYSIINNGRQLTNIIFQK